MGDRGLLYAGALLRSAGVSLTGVLLGLYTEALGYEPLVMGWIVGAGLGGGALAALGVTLAGDRLGRRRCLVALGALGAAGALAAACAAHPLVVGLAAFAGMLNGMGRDRGAAPILDQAILPSTTDDAGRTRAFARYTVLQDVGHALGSLAAGLPGLLVAGFGLDRVGALRGGLGLVAALLAATAILPLFLSGRIEAGRARARAPLSPASRGILARIAGLFLIDSLAGGFLTSALLTYFFRARFDASDGAIALLFFLSRVANALSHLGAAVLARRFGLVNTMVFTHIPGSLLLLTVPLAPSFPVAAALFLLREGLVEMDVPTRQSYVMAVVRPEERTFAAGLTHLVRLGGWAVAPAFAGLLMGGLAPAAPLAVGAGMKIAYDLLLYRAFRHRRPPEETARDRPV